MPLEAWQAWLRLQLLTTAAPYLHDEAVQTHFGFYGRTLSGTPELKERWKRGVALVEGALGEAIGAEYVARHFPPAHKARMEELVANLLAAYRESISDLPWMSQPTIGKALEKLAGFRTKIGYPEKWIDYSSFVPADDVWANVQASNEFEVRRNLAKLGGPIDEAEWHMTPQTVNAYYMPTMNEIVFPAAILQPPSLTPTPMPRPTTVPSARSSATKSDTASTTRARSMTAPARCGTGGRTRTGPPSIG